MRFSPWYLAVLATLAPIASLGGAFGVFAGHAVVLAVTVSIFFGTLTLRREPRPSLSASQTPVPALQPPHKS